MEELLPHRSLAYILYRWKRWGDQNLLGDFLERVYKDTGLLLRYLTSFEKIEVHQTVGDYGTSRIRSIDYRSLAEFTPLDVLKSRLESIKAEKRTQYEENKHIVDLFLDNFHRKDDQFAI